MSVVAMLEGSDSADRASTQTALGIARRLDVPVRRPARLRGLRLRACDRARLLVHRAPVKENKHSK